MYRNLFILFFLSLLIFVGGCGLSGEITDFKRKTTKMRHISISDSKDLKIIDGSSNRTIHIRDISKISIMPQETRVLNDQLYYMAEITLVDSTEIGFESSDKNRIKAFVCIDGILTGKAKGGNLSIPMSEVSELILVH